MKKITEKQYNDALKVIELYNEQKKVKVFELPDYLKEYHLKQKNKIGVVEEYAKSDILKLIEESSIEPFESGTSSHITSSSYLLPNNLIYEVISAIGDGEVEITIYNNFLEK